MNSNFRPKSFTIIEIDILFNSLIELLNPRAQSNANHNNEDVCEVPSKHSLDLNPLENEGTLNI